MSVYSVSSGSINPYSYFAQPISGKMEVPVLASQSLYANFTYVQGVPTQEGGLSLDRLKIIDSLLSQINAHRQAGTPPVKMSDVDLSHPDNTIQALSQEVWKMQQDASAPYKAWGQASALVLDYKV